MTDSGRAVAVITGAAGGLGLACAKRFAPTHSLVLAEHSAEHLERAEQELRATCPDLTAVLCDVSDAAAVAELADVSKRQGELGVLLHTAGLSRSMADGSRIVEVNLIGTALVIDAFQDLAGQGSVAVCISSIGAHRRAIHELDESLLDPLDPGFLKHLDAKLGLTERTGLAYDLSKRGVILLCERAAGAWGARGARIMSLSPGPIDTPMGHLEGARDAKGMETVAALGRVATAEEIAGAAAMLCSADASYVTGCDLRVDGGIVPALDHSSSAAVASAWNALRTETVGIHSQ
jgi:NAD(P)-dependent dehydrogenase (short-subunit alcohol dehydrogenase family)